jgi:conserved hypothetical protein, ribA/ribD-fused
MRIKEFQGEYRWLSNFWNGQVIIEGLTFNNRESAYQAMKCEDESDRKQFCNLTGDQAKRLGRKVKIRSDWDEIKDDVMYKIVFNYFNNNEEEKEKLIATGDAELIEGNTWNDTYWGICNGIGKNKLGKTLMQVREELKNGTI